MSILINYLSIIILISTIFSCSTEKKIKSNGYSKDKKNINAKVENSAIKTKKPENIVSGLGRRDYVAKAVKYFKHDKNAYTQGLLYFNGLLYESTGLKGGSTLRKIDPDNGNEVMKFNLPEKYFAEGIAIYADRLYQLTLIGLSSNTL